MKIKELIWILILLLLSLSCNEVRNSYKSPAGYNLANPEIFNMPEDLREISGITFNKGNADTIYAENDEEGKVYHFRLGDKKMIISEFASPGDFEDITICNGYVVMLRSDGVLFSFPLGEANNKKAGNVLKWKNLLPDGEFEGLYSSESNKELFVLCKHCSNDKQGKRTSGFIFKINDGGEIKSSGSFEINLKNIAALIGKSGIRFRPSGLAYNTFTNEWFILSSVNKLLILTDDRWNVKEAYHLDPAQFSQPEGIAFDNRRNLYISNERNTTRHGTILKFEYKKK